MKKSKILVALLLAFVMAFGVVALVACDNDGGNGGNKGGNNKPIELVLWAPSGAQSFYRGWADKWANGYTDANGVEHPGYTDAQGNKYTVTLGLGEEDGAKDMLINSPTDGADVFMFIDDHMTDLMDNNILAKVGELDAPEGTFAYNIINNNKEMAVNAVTYADPETGKDALYAYPMQADNTYFLYYNPSFLSAEDVKTWDGIFDKLATINEGKEGIDRVKAQMDYGVSWYQAAWFLTFGGKGDASNWNNKDIAYSALQAAHEFSSQKDFISKGHGDPLVTGLLDGSLAAGVSGTWICTGELKARIDNGEIKLAKLPAVRLSTDPKGEESSYHQMRSLLGCKLIGVNAQGKNQTTIMASHYLANFLTSYEVQVDKALKLSAGPSNKIAAELAEVLALPTVNVVAEQSKYSEPQSTTPAAVFSAVSTPINAVDGATPMTSNVYFGADGKCIAEKVDPLIQSMYNTIFPQ